MIDSESEEEERLAGNGTGGGNGPVRYAGKRIAYDMYDIRYNIQYNLHMYHMDVSTVCCTIQYEPVSRSPTVK